MWYTVPSLHMYKDNCQINKIIRLFLLDEMPAKKTLNVVCNMTQGNLKKNIIDLEERKDTVTKGQHLLQGL